MTENLGRRLRALFATIAAISLLGAGVAYGLTWYTQTQLQRDATRDARKLAVDVLQPILLPADAQGPIRGTRYEELLAHVERSVLAGPINGVKLWAADGTVLFADDPALVGRREPEMRDDIHAAIAGTSQGTVEGERFRTLTSLQVGQPPTLLAVELDQSHVALVEQAKERWYPWTIRGGVAAAVCVGLYIAAAIFFSLLVGLERRSAQREASAPRITAKATGRGAKEPASDESLPAYMRPGFQEEVEARRAAEAALAEIQKERAQLLELLRRTEAELEETRARLADSQSGQALPAR
jgi:hypothetical protein